MIAEMASTRATAPLLKDMNERTVLEAIRLGAPISRAEISRQAGISKPTVPLALRSLLEAGLGRQVRLETDLNLAALGEQWQGVARGVSDFVSLSIGTGLGAGVVIGGELRRGRNGAAGELDFARAGDDSYNPDAASVAAIAARLAGRYSTSLVPPYDVRAIFTAARTGDELARAAVAEEARRIARHVAPVAAVVDVELVVLGGGVGWNGDLLLDAIRPHLAQWLP